MNQSFTNSVEQFLKGADWTAAPEHAPAVVSLKAMAEALDKNLMPAMLAQYGLTYRTLLKSKPVDGGEPDPLEKLLAEEESA